MRVDPNYVTNLSSSISQSSSLLANLTGQLSSGLRVSALGDDPAAAAESLQLGSTISKDDTFVQTASRETGALQVTDSALGEVVTQLTSAVSLAAEGTTGTLNAADRAALVQQLKGVQSQILSLSNTSYLGQYVFAGSQGSKPPFSLDASGNAVYAGDTVQQTVQTPSGQALVTNLSGSSVFQAAGQDVFGALSTVIADLSADPIPATAASDATLLNGALTNVTQQRSILDSSLSRLQATSKYTQTQVANLTAEQNTLVAADAVSVATQLQSGETQRQALLSVVATLGKGSLFDYLQ